MFKIIPINRETLSIYVLYFFLIAGGLWHVLNVFQSMMRILATPLLIGLSIWIFADVMRKFEATGKLRLISWAIAIIILSFLIELLGVKTGIIFGNYCYDETLKPKIFDVPVAIGFAWLEMILSSIVIANKFKVCRAKNQVFICSALVSFFMTIFDGVMETAAVTLNYWSWENGEVPLRNYLAWFMISYIFSFFALKMKIEQKINSKIAFHAYFAQLLYFGLIILK